MVHKQLLVPYGPKIHVEVKKMKFGKRILLRSKDNFVWKIVGQKKAKKIVQKRFDQKQVLILKICWKILVKKVKNKNKLELLVLIQQYFNSSPCCPLWRGLGEISGIFHLVKKNRNGSLQHVINSVWYGSSDTCLMASLQSFKGLSHPSDQDPSWRGSPQPKI